MKIRHGFVSNSSSTSFCLYGIYLENDELEKIAKELTLISDVDTDNVDIYGIVDKLIEMYPILSSHYEQNHEGYYLGRKPNSLEDNETGKEFKEKTKKVLDKITNKDTKPDFMTDGWYNG